MIDPALRIQMLDDWIEGEVRNIIRQAVATKAKHLRRLLDDAYFLRRPHHLAPDDYTTSSRDHTLWEWLVYSTSFTAQELKSGFGGTTGNYTRYLLPFFDFPVGNYGYWEGATKHYLLKASVEKRLTDAWRDEQGLVVDASSGQPIGASAFPLNGVVRSSYSKLVVPSLVPIDAKRLDRLIDDAEIRGGLQGERLFVGYRPRHVKTLRRLYELRQWVRHLGGVPNLYADYKTQPTDGSGRLFGVSEPHLQRLKREPRALVYAGTGWWDYDFRACHPTLLLSLATHYGLELPFLDDFLANREELSKEMADEWEIMPSRVKGVINRLLYSQLLARNKHNPLWDLIGVSGIEAVRVDLYYRAIREEVIEAAAAVIKKHSSAGKIVNAVGKVKPLIDPAAGKNTKQSSLLAHILLGYEAWALNEACRDRDDLLVLMHDGWVCKKQVSVKRLEQRLIDESVKQFGFPLRLKLKETQFS